jgi:NAD(P)-dependent dehydrogenase (short-subunit alcohol dehydrogenase family)
MKLQNQVAIVTGSGGIGHTIAARLAGEGARVIIADIREEQVGRERL